MSFVLGLLAGMIVGSIIVLVMGALAAAAQQSRNEELNEVQKANRDYIRKLEHELYGWKNGDE